MKSVKNKQTTTSTTTTISTTKPLSPMKKIKRMTRADGYKIRSPETGRKRKQQIISEIDREEQLRSRHQIIAEDAARVASGSNRRNELTFSDVERSGPGQWKTIHRHGTVDKLPMVPGATTTTTTTTTASKRKALLPIMKVKGDTLKIGLVNDMYGWSQRERASPLEDNLSILLATHNKKEDGNSGSSSSSNIHSPSQFILDIRPGQQKRLEQATTAYSKKISSSSSSSFSPMSTSMSNSNNTSPTLLGSNHNTVNWSKVWENSMRQKQEQVELVELQEQRNMIKKMKDKAKKIKRAKQKKKREEIERKELTKEELNRNPFDLLIGLEKWLHRSFLRVKDAFAELDDDNSGELDVHEFTQLLPKLGLKMKMKDVRLVFDLIDEDCSNSISLEELDRGLRKYKKNMKLESAGRRK